MVSYVRYLNGGRVVLEVRRSGRSRFFRNRGEEEEWRMFVVVVAVSVDRNQKSKLQSGSS